MAGNFTLFCTAFVILCSLHQHLPHFADNGGIIVLPENGGACHERVRAGLGDFGDIARFHAAIDFQRNPPPRLRLVMVEQAAHAAQFVQRVRGFLDSVDAEAGWVSEVA